MENKAAHGEKPDAVILCGGLGTRLRSLFPNRPKVLAPINGTTFLDMLLRRIRREGVGRVILAVGHHKEALKDHFKDDETVLISEEDEPLGTGGALKQALPLLSTDPFLVFNGDTFCPADLSALLRAHRQQGALLTIVLTPEARPDGGGVARDPRTARITNFIEKGAVRQGFMNAGIYCMSRAIAAHLPTGAVFSLEYDLFPSLAAAGACFSFVFAAPVIDIGTSDRYRAARAYFRTHAV